MTLERPFIERAREFRIKWPICTISAINSSRHNGNVIVELEVYGLENGETNAKWKWRMKRKKTSSNEANFLIWFDSNYLFWLHFITNYPYIYPSIHPYTFCNKRKVHVVIFPFNWLSPNFRQFEMSNSCCTIKAM